MEEQTEAIGRSDRMRPWPSDRGLEDGKKVWERIMSLSDRIKAGEMIPDQIE
jgi:hypothetical protein